MSNKKFKNAEEFAAACEQFFKSHPDAPIVQDIECLDLIMKKVYAEQILAGTKKLEFREYKDFYVKRLIDPDMFDYIRSHIDDDNVVMFCSDIRQVKKIHFHDYNKSWYLDIECDFNDVFSINKKDIEYLQKKYGCHDYDDDLKRMEVMAVPQNERPYLFYFVCGKVLGTNLDVKPKDDECVDICGGIKYDVTGKFKKWMKEAEETANKDIITFKVSKEEYNSIVSGQVGVFEKEIKSNKVSQYFKTDEKGNVIFIKGVPQFRRYDAIQFTNKENSYTCLINNADLLFLDGESGEMISYTELEAEENNCTEGVIAYTLGEEVKQ